MSDFAELGAEVGSFEEWTLRVKTASTSDLQKKKVDRTQQIVELRKQGMTLQNIGDQVCLSRERVRQILERKFGTTFLKNNLITAQEAMAILGIPQATFYSRCHKKGVKVVYGRRWDRSVLDIVSLGNCRICGKSIPTHRFVYCSEECRIEGGAYRNRPLWVKKKHNVLVYMWRRSHPNEQKIIHDKAMRKYNDKRCRNTVYRIVSKKLGIPYGTVVTGGGCSGISGRVKVIFN